MARRSAEVETWLGVCYCRHRPKDRPLYQTMERHYPLLEALRAEQGRALPAFVVLTRRRAPPPRPQPRLPDTRIFFRFSREKHPP